jgi:pyruvyl transferase EpsO
VYRASSGIAHRLDREACIRKAGLHLQRGITVLSHGRTVITDRLHAQILCELLQIPNIAVDTGYGKIRSNHETWLAGSPTSSLVFTAAEAVLAAQRAAATADPAPGDPGAPG